MSHGESVEILKGSCCCYWLLALSPLLSVWAASSLWEKLGAMSAHRALLLVTFRVIRLLGQDARRDLFFHLVLGATPCFVFTRRENDVWWAWFFKFWLFFSLLKTKPVVLFVFITWAAFTLRVIKKLWHVFVYKIVERAILFVFKNWAASTFKEFWNVKTYCIHWYVKQMKEQFSL